MTIRAVAIAGAALVLSAAFASAHICMWQPMQRGAFAINVPGSDPCYQKPGPCGGVPYNPNGVRTTLTAGSQYTVEFQQNLNHYYVQNPGYLEVSWATGTNPTEQQFAPLGHSVSDWNAMDMITQTNFSITVTIPSAVCAQCVLRTRYLSNNPLENDRGEVFHQCADVAVVAATEEQRRHQQPRQHQQPRATVPRSMVLPHAERVGKEGFAPAGCCVNTQQFVTNWSETGSYRAATRGTTYYDAINRLLRVDTQSGNGQSIYDGTFTHFNNFTSGIEYYLNVVTGACEPLGLDLWNNWCYGPNNNQSEAYFETVTFGASTVNIWQNGDFYFGATADASCTPVLLTRPTSGMMTLYYDYTPGGIPDPTVFTPPPQCHLALADHIASGKPLRRSKLDIRKYLPVAQN